MITLDEAPCAIVSGPTRQEDVYTRHFLDRVDAQSALGALQADDDENTYTITISEAPCVTVTCDTCGREYGDPADGDTVHFPDVDEARRVGLADGWVPGHIRDLTIRCPECVPAGPWVVRRILPKRTRCHYGCPEPYRNYPVTVIRLDRLDPAATVGSIAACIRCATPLIGLDPCVIRGWARRIDIEREIWMEARAQWFRAERNRTLGPFATYNMIELWKGSEEFRDASSVWFRMHPEPRYPRS